MQTFDIQYRVTVGKNEEIDQKIEGICLEQSVELPMRVLTGQIREKIVGQFKQKKRINDDVWEVTISFPYGNIGDEIPNFLNILYGNISMQKGILITGLEWETLFRSKLFSGPAHGISKIRKLFGIRNRALSSTALKPLGYTPEKIADLCYQFALGGIDLIKDDHGITNQSYAPFTERVRKCMASIEKASNKTGTRSYYFPNITATAEESIKRYNIAVDLDVDGVLICPHIAGMETMHRLAQMENSLPIAAHPAFSGGLTNHNKQGLTPQFLYGQLWRALGADFVIYPNINGRFSFTMDQCKAINASARDPHLPFSTAFPMPGGGMKLDKISSWLETYGPDTVFLIGSSLYDYSGGNTEAAKLFRNALNG